MPTSQSVRPHVEAWRRRESQGQCAAGAETDEADRLPMRPPRDAPRQRVESGGRADVWVGKLHHLIPRVAKDRRRIRGQRTRPRGIEAIPVEDEDEGHQRPVLAFLDARFKTLQGRIGSEHREPLGFPRGDRNPLNRNNYAAKSRRQDRPDRNNRKSNPRLMIDIINYLLD